VDGVVRVRSIFGRTHSHACGLHGGYRAYAAFSHLNILGQTRGATYQLYVVGNGSWWSRVEEVWLRSIEAALVERQASPPTVNGVPRLSFTSNLRLLLLCHHNNPTSTIPTYGRACHPHVDTSATPLSYARRPFHADSLSSADSLAYLAITYERRALSASTPTSRQDGKLIECDTAAAHAAPPQGMFEDWRVRDDAEARRGNFW